MIVEEALLSVGLTNSVCDQKHFYQLKSFRCQNVSVRAEYQRTLVFELKGLPSIMKE